MTEEFSYTPPMNASTISSHRLGTQLLDNLLEKLKSIWDAEDDSTMQLVDVELEKHTESRTSTHGSKFLSHSIEEILKKPSSLTVRPDRTDLDKTSGCTQTNIKPDAPKISQCTGVFFYCQLISGLITCLTLYFTVSLLHA